jgi:hypothetical protein
MRSFSESEEEQLQLIDQHYWVERDIFEKLLRPSEIIKKLDRIMELAPLVDEWNRLLEGMANRTEDLLICSGEISGRYRDLQERFLKDLNPEQAKKAAEILIGNVKNGLMKAFSRITTNATDLQRIANAAKEVRSRLTDQGGRNAKLAVKELINRLADFFENFTEKRATIKKNQYKGKNGEYEGAFFNFVESFFRILDKKRKSLKLPGSLPLSNSAIGNQIQRTLKDRPWRMDHPIIKRIPTV